MHNLPYFFFSLMILIQAARIMGKCMDFIEEWATCRPIVHRYCNESMHKILKSIPQITKNSKWSVWVSRRKYHFCIIGEYSIPTAHKIPVCTIFESLMC